MFSTLLTATPGTVGDVSVTATVTAYGRTVSTQVTININCAAPEFSLIYVVNDGDGTVSVIDEETNTVIDTILLAGTIARGIGVNSSTRLIYVANANADTVSVIDGATNTIVATIPVGSFPYDIGILN